MGEPPFYGKLMHKTCGSLFLAVACVSILAACGANGGTDSVSASTPFDPQSKQLHRSEKAQASDYQTVVQQLYVSYFGRPADPTGLVNFESALLAANAPTDIQGLNAAYSTSPAIQSLVNSFETSNESQNLYGSGNPTAFVTAVFENVLNRPPQ
jgi:predicted lipid-binding transport protein (Tim44 family)